MQEASLALPPTRKAAESGWSSTTSAGALSWREPVINGMAHPALPDHAVKLTSTTSSGRTQRMERSSFAPAIRVVAGGGQASASNGARQPFNS